METLDFFKKKLFRYNIWKISTCIINDTKHIIIDIEEIEDDIKHCYKDVVCLMFLKTYNVFRIKICKC